MMVKLSGFLDKIKESKLDNNTKLKKVEKNYFKIPDIDYELYLKRFEENNDLSILPDLFWLCLLRNDDKKKRAIRKLTNISSKFSSKEFLYLYKLFRERTSLGWQFNWGDISMDMILEDDMTEDERISLLGLASFNPNGYMREEAVIELAKYKNPIILPFIIIRIDDWVNNISKISQETLLNHINKDNFINIIKNIKLIENIKDKVENQSNYYGSYYNYRYNKLLEKQKRINQILDEIEYIFNNYNVIKELQECTLSEDIYVKEYSLKNLINRELIDCKTTIDIMVKFSDGYISYKILKLLLPKMTREELIKYKDILWKVKGFKCKNLLIDSLYSIGYYKKANELEEEALSKYTSVRDTARFYMKKLGFEDFFKLYKDNLNNYKFKEGAILGLCEVCSKNEGNILIEHFKDSNSKIEKKILATIGEFDNWLDYKYMFINSLESKHISTIKTSKRFILKNMKHFNVEEIYKLYKESVYEPTVLSAAEILSSGSSWTSISYIIEILGDKNEKVSQIGKKSLNDWFFIMKHYYIRKDLYSEKYYYIGSHVPNESEKVRLNYIINKYWKVLKEDDLKELKTMLKQ